MTDYSGERRTSSDAAPWVDAQSLSDADTFIYETVATLGFFGRPADRAGIAEASRMDDSSLDSTLAELTSRGVLAVSDADGGPAYSIARRDWSSNPDELAGHLLS
ncbi:MAG TPA: hypothetical protein VME44_05560 [Streptosporangiaceae bacterium]|nr:hypothetical protein [Streptosporangiaceae bacterium]